MAEGWRADAASRYLSRANGDTKMTEPASTATEAAGTPARACANCGTPLLGPHCYRCGQPVDGLVRHFGSIMGDFLDTVLNIDARVFRTLWPLLS
jgi:hypothetical protein